MTNPRFSIPRAAYIHVPFCRHRCGYCNFSVVAGRNELIDAYLRALEIELSWLQTPRPVETLYLGGGTPTHLRPDQLERLLSIARRWFALQDANEFTVEANPCDMDSERTTVLREAGVNRVSLGVQSFQTRKLKILEREHRRAHVERASHLLGQVPMNLAFDLLFGVPGETLDEWQADLESTMAFRPHHLSVYGLTVERGSRFFGRRRRGELAAVPELLERAMYELAIDTLANQGYEHYEVSNWARPAKRCRHNEVYWTGRGYYAAGPGAARYIDGCREINHRSTTTYLRRVLAGRSPVAERETLSAEDSARERLVFALRRLEGVRLEEFAAETGFSALELCGQAFEKYCELKLLELTSSSLRLTREGLLVSDSIWPDLLRS